MSNRTKRRREAGHEDEPVYFYFSASLRIFGNGLDIDEITRELGLTPTLSHRKGERHGARSVSWREDMWLYQAPVDETRPLHEHITALWDAVRLHIPYLRNLKRAFHVDVFCGYRSNSGSAGFEVDHRCLGLFTELEVPFGVSVIVR